jgi:hypothetical protein
MHDWLLQAAQGHLPDWEPGGLAASELRAFSLYGDDDDGGTSIAMTRCSFAMSLYS